MGIIRQVNLGFNKRRNSLPRKRTRPVQGNPFSQRIAHLRKQQGLTMSALADLIGVTASYISLLEAGGRQPSREIVLKLAHVFFGSDDKAQIDDLLVLAGLSPMSYEPQYQMQDTQSMYQEHLNQHPDDFKTYTALIRLLIRQTEYAKAEALIYDGLKRFQDAAQLQALMAQLQLCLKVYATAATFQSAAIDLHRSQHSKVKPKQDPELADLYTNLGVIYFLWGSEQFEASLQAKASTAKQLKKEALLHFEQAQQHYLQALSISPDDVFLLDEYARICFNLADLNLTGQQSSLWDQAIEAFYQVICAEDVTALGMESVREANAFLAHAHSKAGYFEQARKLIGVIQSCNPDYWLIYYIKACYHSLRIIAGFKQDAELGWVAFERARSIQHPHNASLAYAQHDPDLQALKQLYATEFTKLIPKSNRGTHTQDEN